MLRLACLHSVLCGGLKPKILESYRYSSSVGPDSRRDIVHVYGHEHIVTLDNLEKCGLLRLQVSFRRFFSIHSSLFPTTATPPPPPSSLAPLTVPQDGRNVFPLLRKQLQLSYADSLAAPTDIGYVHTAYAPVSVRIAHILSRPDGRSDEALRLLPGPSFEFSQSSASGSALPILMFSDIHSDTSLP